MARLSSLPAQTVPAEVAGSRRGEADGVSGGRHQFGRIGADAGERFRNLVPAPQFRLLLRVLFRRAPRPDTQADWMSPRFSVAATPDPTTHPGKRGILDPDPGPGIETDPGGHNAPSSSVAAESSRATLAHAPPAPGAGPAGAFPRIVLFPRPPLLGGRTPTAE